MNNGTESKSVPPGRRHVRDEDSAVASGHFLAPFE